MPIHDVSNDAGSNVNTQSRMTAWLTNGSCSGLVFAWSYLEKPWKPQSWHPVSGPSNEPATSQNTNKFHIQTATMSVKHAKWRKAHLGIVCTPMCQSRVCDVHRTHRRATSGMFCNLSFWNRDRPVWEQPDLLDSPALCSIISNCYVTVAITPERYFRRWFSLHVYILSCSPKHYVIAASWTPVVTSPPNNGLQLQKLLTGSK